MTPPANVHHAAQMRVLAHPTRLRLLALLRELGPRTAAHLAEFVDEAPGSLSYHLRKLASAGFIEEAPEAGSDGRQRWWRASHEATQWDTAEFTRDPERLAAQQDLFALLGQFYARQLTSYMQSAADLPLEWVEAGFVTDRRLRLTAAQLAELSAEITELEGRWLDVSAANVAASTAQDADSAGSPSRQAETAEVFFLAQGYQQP